MKESRVRCFVDGFKERKGRGKSLISAVHIILGVAILCDAVRSPYFLKVQISATKRQH